jgi:hypothetical protein
MDDRQGGLADEGFERYRKPTRREQFLEETERIIPWSRLDPGPVRRAISCWFTPLASSVSMVMRKCDFKTFNSWLPDKREAA